MHNADPLSRRPHLENYRPAKRREEKFWLNYSGWTRNLDSGRRLATIGALKRTTSKLIATWIKTCLGTPVLKSNSSHWDSITLRWCSRLVSKLCCLWCQQWTATATKGPDGVGSPLETIKVYIHLSPIPKTDRRNKCIKGQNIVSSNGSRQMPHCDLDPRQRLDMPL